MGEASNLIVARAWQWDENRLRKDAQNDHADRLAQGEPDPDYSVSVFALPGDDVTDAEVREQLMTKIKEHRRTKWVTFTTSARLEDAGFGLRLSEPPPDHHDVVLGDDLASANLAGLASVFNEQQRQRMS